MKYLNFTSSFALGGDPKGEELVNNVEASSIIEFVKQ
jgi:hypothetical protein